MNLRSLVLLPLLSSCTFAAGCGPSTSEMPDQEIVPPDLAVTPPDLITPPKDGPGVLDAAPHDLSHDDLFVPDLIMGDFAMCEQGERACGSVCIARQLCCADVDCQIKGQVCEVDGGTCDCPADFKICDKTCIPNNNCCTNADCPSKVCRSGACIPASCSDMVQNGDESDTDCGGKTCPGCVPGKICGVDADCASNSCVAGTCGIAGFNGTRIGSGKGTTVQLVRDIDGDGNLDIVVSNGANDDVGVLLGNGDGTFGTQANFSIGGWQPYGVDAEDVNGDTFIDLVVGNSGLIGGFLGNTYGITTLLGKGDGTFGAPIQSPTMSPVKTVSLGDWNGDGNPDVIGSLPGLVQNGMFVNAGTVIYTGNGDGTFTVAETYPGSTSTWAGVADFNSDGKSDFISLQGSPATSLLVYLGGGDATFKQTNTYVVASSGPGVIADFNNDKIPDVILGISGAILKGKLDGSLLASGSVMQTTTSLSAMDVDNDGNVDIASLEQPMMMGTHLLSVRRGNGNLTFGVARATPLAGRVVSMLLTDLNVDALGDVVFYYDTSFTSSLVGESTMLGKGGAMFGGIVSQPTSLLPQSIGAGDFNGDKNVDLVANLTDSSAVVFLNNGKNHFQTPRAFPAAVMGLSQPGTVAVGDVDGDKKLDFVAAGAGTWLGKGDGTFTLVPCPACVDTLSLTDFDGDGALDLLMSSLGNTSISLGTKDGKFTPGALIATAAGPHGHAIADVNGDGIPDVVVTNQSAASVSVMFGKAKGVLGAPVNYPAAGSPLGVTIADLNGDKKLDLAIAAGPNTTNAWVLLNNGDGTFGKATSVTTLKGPVAIVARDFDGDGKIDLATVDHDSKVVSLLIGNGNGTFKNPRPNVAGTGARAFVATDIDNNMKADLVVVDETIGEASMLLNAF